MRNYLLLQKGMPALIRLLNYPKSSGCFSQGTPGSPTNPTWELFFAPGPKSSLGRGFFWTLQRPGELCGAAIPAEVSQPPHALAPGPVPSSASPACLSFPAWISPIWADRSSEGEIHPLLRCRGRSWHCDQNYSPKVQPWNFYCGSQ